MCINYPVNHTIYCTNIIIASTHFILVSGTASVSIVGGIRGTRGDQRCTFGGMKYIPTLCLCWYKTEHIKIMWPTLVLIGFAFGCAFMHHQISLAQ